MKKVLKIQKTKESNLQRVKDQELSVFLAALVYFWQWQSVENHGKVFSDLDRLLFWLV